MTLVVPSDTHIQVEGAEGSTNMMQLITLRLGLKFEIEHPNMKMTRRPLVPIAQHITGCKRSKKAAWEAVNDVISQVRPDMAMPRPW